MNRFWIRLFFIATLFFACGSRSLKTKDNMSIKNDPPMAKPDIKVEKREMIAVLPTPKEIVGHNVVFLRTDMKGYHRGVFVEGRRIEIAPYEIAQYETTYSLWKAVYDWATSKERGEAIYTIVHKGVNGSKNASLMEGKISLQPVGKITWRDAIVWCNAYSELSGLRPVYYKDGNKTEPHRSSDFPDALLSEAGAIDNPYVDWDATGYRLPTEAEWEMAARGGDVEISDWNFAYSGVKGYRIENGVPIFEPYNEEYTEADGSWPNFMWIMDNSIDETHSVGSRKPNRLNLYDMSGNVEEYCWDFYGDYDYIHDSNHAFNPLTPVHGEEKFGRNRVRRGGRYNYNNGFALVSYRGHVSMTSAYDSGIGFRVARTIKLE